MGFNWSAATRGAGDALERMMADRYARTEEARRVARQIALDEEAKADRTYNRNRDIQRDALDAMNQAALTHRQNKADERQGVIDARTAQQWDEQRAEQQRQRNQEIQDRAVQSMMVAGVKGGGMTPYQAQMTGAEQNVNVQIPENPVDVRKQKLADAEDLLKLQRRYATPAGSGTPQRMVSADGKQEQFVTGTDNLNKLMAEGWRPFDQVQARQQATLKAAGEGKQNKQAQFFSESLDMAEALKSMPGKAGAVGRKGPTSLFGAMDTPFEGTNAGDWVVVYNTLKSRLTLPELQKLAGTGPVSEVEFKTVGEGAAALDRAFQEGTFDTFLDRLIAELKTKYTQASGGLQYESKPPVTPQGPAGYRPGAPLGAGSPAQNRPPADPNLDPLLRKYLGQ